MSSVLKKTGLTMAIAAAGLFAATSANAITAPHGDEAKVHCYGVTACKGQNDCKTDKNACKGKGSCKGHGFKSMSDKECKAAGGKMKKMKMKKAH